MRVLQRLPNIDMNASHNKPDPEAKEPESSARPPVIKNPRVSKTKGRDKVASKKRISAKDARYKHHMEGKLRRKPRKCCGCGELVFHDVRNCPNPFKFAGHVDADMDEDDDTYADVDTDVDA